MRKTGRPLIFNGSFNRILVECEDKFLEFIFSEDGKIHTILTSEDGKLWSVASIAYIDKEIIYSVIRTYNEARPKSSL